MNRLMWSHPATTANCLLLQSRGISFIGPDEGAQACGETGAGRLLEPEDIRDQLIMLLDQLSPQTKTEPENCVDNQLAKDDQFLLQGVNLLITAGPTREAIDPVRFISNHSSGKMGFAIAEAARRMGASVTLVAGPVSLELSSEQSFDSSANPLKKIHRIDIVTAQQMLDATMAAVPDADVFVSVAAVSDYRLESVMDQKIKKNDEHMQLNLIKNPDILKSVAALENKPFCVGFAAETQHMHSHALEKLKHKNLDMIAANNVGQADNPVFGADTNALDVYWADAEKHGHEHISSGQKSEVALQLLTLIAYRLNVRA